MSKEKVKDSTQNDDTESEKNYDISDFRNVYEIVVRKSESKDVLEKAIHNYLEGLQEKFKLSQYKIVYLFDEYSSISSFMTDKIYEKIKDCEQKKDIFLIINSSGGSGEPSYLLSKALKRLSKDKFIVAIPRRAKSAATLISLGADEIHMGLMSELGPIDLQVGGYPALGLGNSLDYIAKIVTKYPMSSNLFATYLTNKLDLIHLGYLERLGESTVQYGERLIGAKKLPEGNTAVSVARKLVYEYKDHSFVIDIDEARSLLGDGIVKENSEEYKLSNEVYSTFDMISTLYALFNDKEFSYVGDNNDGLNLKKIKSK